MMSSVAATTSPQSLAELRTRLSELRKRWTPPHQRRATGMDKLDHALGGGILTGAVHELRTAGDAAPARALALWIAARMIKSGCVRDALPEPPALDGVRLYVEKAHAGGADVDKSPCADARRWLLYVDTDGDFYPPGAAQLGLPLERLLIVRTRRRLDALWVCEQALRCRAIAVVILPLSGINAYASRRLQLAAEAGEGIGLLIRHDRGGHTFAATRTRVASAESCIANHDRDRDAANTVAASVRKTG